MVLVILYLLLAMSILRFISSLCDLFSDNKKSLTTEKQEKENDWKRVRS